MALLIVNPNTPEAWQLKLSNGEHILGSGTENQVVLEHPSVSSSHCSLTVKGHQAFIRDLESTSGTFVSGQRVDQAELLSGSNFRLGDVELQFQAVADQEQPKPHEGDDEFAETRTPVLHCKYHPRVLARNHCPKCNLGFCDFCVDIRAGQETRMCRRCGSPCRRLQVRAVKAAPRQSFWKLLPSALVYPFRGSGVLLLILGGVFFVLLGWMPLLGLLITGYLFNYAKQIVATSAAGKADPPDWPEFTDWFDTFLVPYFHLFALTVLAFGPAILLLVFMPGEEPTLWAGVGVGVATLFGAFLAPMGMLALAMFDTVWALNPVSLVWSILRIPGHYVVAALAFLITTGVAMFSENLLSLVIPIILLPYVISGFISLYLLAVAMRIVGLLYWCKKDKLGWF